MRNGTVHHCGPGGLGELLLLRKHADRVEGLKRALSASDIPSHTRSFRCLVSKLRDAHFCQPNLSWFGSTSSTRSVRNHHCQVPPTKWVKIGFCQHFPAMPDRNQTRARSRSSPTNLLCHRRVPLLAWLDNQPHWPNAQHDESLRHWQGPDLPMSVASWKRTCCSNDFRLKNSCTYCGCPIGAP